tara:strand:+ start:544 stop:1059 length:516 start_codon:yes stop_codon:yes gene_type:complete
MKKIIIIRKWFLMIMPTAFLLYCTPTEKNTDRIQKEQIENKRNESSLDDKRPIEELSFKENSFEDFFKKFSGDSIFQKRRIRYPISCYTFDILDNREEYVISREDWVFENFMRDKEAPQFEYDAYESVVKKIDVGEVIYKRRGIDNGIMVEYYFFLRNEKWILEQIIDRSN